MNRHEPQGLLDLATARPSELAIVGRNVTAVPVHREPHFDVRRHGGGELQPSGRPHEVFFLHLVQADACVEEIRLQTRLHATEPHLQSGGPRLRRSRHQESQHGYGAHQRFALAHGLPPSPAREILRAGLRNSRKGAIRNRDSGANSVLGKGRNPGKLEAATGVEPVNKGFADLRLNHLATPPQACRKTLTGGSGLYPADSLLCSGKK
jgi:hypothetical protein